MLELESKIALVTGGGRGIGRATALALAKAGAKIAVTARTTKEIDEVAKLINELGGTAIAVEADLTSERDIKRLISETESSLGQVDILVNNAGALKLSPIAQTSTEMWDELFSVNLRAVFLTCREVLPQMIERCSGRVINVGSMAGRRGYEEQGAYCASKHGLIGLSKVMALETQKYGIRVHVLAPGGVMTELSRHLRESRGGADDSNWMSAEEVAAAVLYLCTQTGPAITDELALRRFESEPWR